MITVLLCTMTPTRSTYRAHTNDNQRMAVAIKLSSSRIHHFALFRVVYTQFGIAIPALVGFTGRHHGVRYSLHWKVLFMSLSMNNGSKIVYNEHKTSLTAVLDIWWHCYYSASIMDVIVFESTCRVRANNVYLHLTHVYNSYHRCFQPLHLPVDHIYLSRSQTLKICADGVIQ